MNITATATPFSLQRQTPGGGITPLDGWGFASETNRLTDVLPGSSASLRLLATSSLSQWRRRGENTAAIRNAETLGIQIDDMVTTDAYKGGDFNAIEDGASLPGGGRVILPSQSQTLSQQLKARGFEIAQIDMCGISKTGGGIHCMAQSLCREQ